MSQTVTLIGYLGRTPEIRDTATRTLEIERYNPVAESTDTREYETRSREYAVFSVATHSGHGPSRTTTWHRCIVFNVDRLEHLPLRMAKGGEKVAVTGRREPYTYTDGAGQSRTLQQIVVESFRVLQHKPAPAGDPDEPFVLPRRRVAA